MAKTLPTTKFLTECLSYDPASGALTWKVRPQHHFSTAHKQARWNGQHAGKRAGRIGRYIHISITIGIKPTCFLAHRLIWKMQTGRWPRRSIDHVNCDILDNSWQNLREATPQQNGWWRQPSGRDLPRGVGPSKNGTRYTARIRIKGISTNLGTYDTPEEAHAVWCAIARKERGRFFRAE